MKKFLFIIWFIWFFASLGALLIGPFVFFDKSATKAELKKFWDSNNTSWYLIFFRRFILIFSFSGFFFPVLYPWLSLPLSVLIIYIFASI